MATRRSSKAPVVEERDFKKEIANLGVPLDKVDAAIDQLTSGVDEVGVEQIAYATLTVALAAGWSRPGAKAAQQTSAPAPGKKTAAAHVALGKPGKEGHLNHLGSVTITEAHLKGKTKETVEALPDPGIVLCTHDTIQAAFAACKTANLQGFAAPALIWGALTADQQAAFKDWRSGGTAEPATETVTVFGGRAAAAAPPSSGRKNGNNVIKSAVAALKENPDIAKLLEIWKGKTSLQMGLEAWRNAPSLHDEWNTLADGLPADVSARKKAITEDHRFVDLMKRTLEVAVAKK